jgi:hypothetical protein
VILDGGIPVVPVTDFLSLSTASSHLRGRQAVLLTSRSAMFAEIRVGDAEQHVVGVFSSFWSGLEILTVDGKEVIRRRSLSPFITLIWDVGVEEKHTVEIRLNGLLLSSRAFVDGQCVRRCLFPQVYAYTVLASALGVLLVLLLAWALGAGG